MDKIDILRVFWATVFNFFTGISVWFVGGVLIGLLLPGPKGPTGGDVTINIQQGPKSN